MGEWSELEELLKDLGLPKGFIQVDFEGVNKIAFTIQSGPVKEVGVNGCQVDWLLIIVRHLIGKFNKEFPCRENSVALTKIDEALMWLDKRTKDREKRNAEGRSLL